MTDIDSWKEAPWDYDVLKRNVAQHARNPPENVELSSYLIALEPGDYVDYQTGWFVVTDDFGHRAYFRQKEDAEGFWIGLRAQEP
jgi:hypothetical protein